MGVDYALGIGTEILSHSDAFARVSFSWLAECSSDVSTDVFVCAVHNCTSINHLMFMNSNWWPRKPKITFLGEHKMEDSMRMPNFLTPVIHVLVLVYCLIPCRKCGSGWLTLWSIRGHTHLPRHKPSLIKTVSTAQRASQNVYCRQLDAGSKVVHTAWTSRRRLSSCSACSKKTNKETVRAGHK